MLAFDLMTSPPSSTAPSPSLASLARIPALSPSFMAPVPRRASNTTFNAPDMTPPPRSPGCLPAGLSTELQDRPLPDLPPILSHPPGSHSETVSAQPSMTFDDTNLFAARAARPSCPASVLVPILNVTVGQTPPSGRPAQARKPSFKIPMPLTTTPATPSDRISVSLSRPSLAVSYGGDENASRRSSFTRTPYPVDEAEDYISSRPVDIRRVHPCDKDTAGEGIQWTDPWASANEAVPLRTPTDVQPSRVGPEAKGAKVDQSKARVKVGSVDVSNWSSVGMEQAWSADSQSAVEGDSLLLEA